MHNGVKKVLDDVYNVMLRYKYDYMKQIVYGEDNRYLYVDMCEDIERHAEPFVMGLVKQKKLEINDAKRFLSTLFDMAIDIHLEGKRIPWWLKLKRIVKNVFSSRRVQR